VKIDAYPIGKGFYYVEKLVRDPDPLITVAFVIQKGGLEIIHKKRKHQLMLPFI
jgi:hypothetical protein